MFSPGSSSSSNVPSWCPHMRATVQRLVILSLLSVVGASLGVLGPGCGGLLLASVAVPGLVGLLYRREQKGTRVWLAAMSFNASLVLGIAFSELRWRYHRGFEMTAEIYAFALFALFFLGVASFTSCVALVVWSIFRRESDARGFEAIIRGAAPRG